MNYRHGWDRHRRRNNDQGTSLLIVLIIVTMIGLAMSALLSQVDTSVKATIVLRDQAASNYGADAAAQAAVTQLSKGSAFGSACTTPATTTTTFGTSSSNPFYQASNTTTGSLNATVTCTPDAVTGVTATVTGSGAMVGPTNTPTAALTTVGTNVLDGVLAGVGNNLCIQGSVVSYTSIAATMAVGANQQNSATACPNVPNAAITVRAYGNPLPVVPGCLGSFLITPCAPLGATRPAIATVPDPGLAITAANTDQAAVCTVSGGKTYAAFKPGLYTRLSSTTTNSLSTPCKVNNTWVKADVEWFTPGVYYFNFGATTWKLPAALVGGTPALPNGQPIAGLNLAVPSTLANLSQMPTGEGKCIAPTAQTGPGMDGVEFVFGGASTMTGITPPTRFGIPIGPSTDMNICATYSATSPPVAIYGANQNLTEGSVQIPAQSGCVVSPTCVDHTRSLLNTPSPVADQTFHIDGYVWGPLSTLALSYVNATGQAFNWGILVRSFQMLNLGVFSTPMTMINLPDPNVGQVTTYTYSIRYVNVWTCAASSTPCPTTGEPDVRVKLQNTGSTWKVLSWTAQR